MKHRLIIGLALIMLFLVGFVNPSYAQTANCTDFSSASMGSPNFTFPIYAGQTITFTFWASPTNPAGDVVSVNISGTFAGTPFTLSGTDRVSFTDVAPSNGTWEVTSSSVAVRLTDALWFWSFSAVCPSTPNVPAAKYVPLFPDGRLNNDHAHETAAVYCKDGGVTVYVPGDPKWLRAFHANADEINEIPKNPAKNTLIKQGKGARLYRLTSGKLQVNAPELDPTKGDYVFIFGDCSAA